MSADLADLERRVTALERAQNDTTDTLRWVVAKLGRISAVQESTPCALSASNCALIALTRVSTA